MERPRAIPLAGGRRLRLLHGPMDVTLSADGDEQAVAAAHAAAWHRFRPLLQELVDELPQLRSPALPGHNARCQGSVARRMERAALALADHGFITPMAAVAGAVAEELLASMLGATPDLERAAVNNGGDIALHLAPGHGYTVAMAHSASGPGPGSASGKLRLTATDGIAGIATSGRHGRSLSLGIADAVTVLAERASLADAAATLIANRVDLPGHDAIIRRPAREVQPDSDLGARPVVIQVAPLSAAARDAALEAGIRFARELTMSGLVRGAALFLADGVRLTGPALPTQA